MRSRLLLASAAACAVSAGEARAETDRLFPLQVDLAVEVMSGSEMWTSGLYFNLSYVRTLTSVGRGWLVFGGLGVADDVVTNWQRDGRRAPDAISALHAPGIEARVGLMHGTQLGAPRFVLKVTPMWARGATDMELPDDRGLGVRASAGLTWPAWILGRLDPDPPGSKSYEQTYPLRLVFAALVPSEIEYVFQHVPGDNRHGIAFGWGF